MKVEDINNYKPNEYIKDNNSFSKVEIISNNKAIIENGHLRAKQLETLYIKIFIAIVYFALVICLDEAYREDLFYESIDVQEDIREDHDKDSAFYDFWDFMSNFGLAKVTFPIFAIIFVFFPLSSSFLTLQVLIYSIYITNLFKIIYRYGRPYWKSNILDIVCNSGYGNPSGHSVTSAAYYLTLPHIVTNFSFFSQMKKGIILKIVIFCLFIILGTLVIISRVMLAAHSFDQIIYGTTLGIGIYYVAIYILSYHKYAPDTFINHITSSLVVMIYMILHIILIIILIIIYFSLSDNGKIKTKVLTHIFNGIRCKIKKKYTLLKHDGFFQALAITSILGAHLGIILLVYFLKRNNYIINGHITEFNKSSIKRWLIRLPILIVSGIFIILNFCIPGSSPLSIIFIFKSAISFFFTTLGIFFIGIFISIYCNLANENIMKNK